MTPFVSDPDFTLYVGDALQVLRELPTESVHICCTSPPYWGLRDYGTGAWAGGEQISECRVIGRVCHDHCDCPLVACDHLMPVGGLGKSTLAAKRSGAYGKCSSEAERAAQERQRLPYKERCGKCGATRVDRQLGLEPTPDEYVAAIVAVFREVRRVLRADGTLWLNLGDSYAGYWGDKTAKREGRRSSADTNGWTNDFNMNARPDFHTAFDSSGLKPKDLCGIPWAVAFALRADGWYLRSDIIWSKPNPMPESVTDRPTKSHEYVFLLSKSPRYFFDQEAVREPAEYGYRVQKGAPMKGRTAASSAMWRSAGDRTTPVERGGMTVGGKGDDPSAGRNLRSVWEIATQPYPQAHFATFPEALPDRCIRAGTSERGCCPECGAAWVREVETGEPELDPRVWSAKGVTQYDDNLRGMRDMDGTGSTLKHTRSRETTGWSPSCDCDLSGRFYAGPVPCTVLDPFMGSGTTALVARKLGRRSIGIELSPEYAALAADRLKQLSLFAVEA